MQVRTTDPGPARQEFSAESRIRPEPPPERDYPVWRHKLPEGYMEEYQRVVDELAASGVVPAPDTDVAMIRTYLDETE